MHSDGKLTCDVMEPKSPRLCRSNNSFLLLHNYFGVGLLCKAEKRDLTNGCLLLI